MIKFQPRLVFSESGSMNNGTTCRVVKINAKIGGNVGCMMSDVGYQMSDLKSDIRHLTSYIIHPTFYILFLKAFYIIRFGGYIAK